MKYQFDCVLHSSFSFSVDADSYEEALEKTREISNNANSYYDFPEANVGEIELHMCYAEETDDDGVVNRIGCIDEWI